ncbi:MAG: serine/threonine-protein kinase [Chthoniobacterales bacterium]
MSHAAENWVRIKSVFAAVVDLPPEERATILEEECGSDEIFRQEVESLLQADAAANAAELFEEPPLRLPDDLLPDEEADSVTGSSVGAYRIIEEIGRGGLGTVYLGERADDAYRKEVAIKLVRRGLDTEDILERFRHERQILANLDHPYIARLLDGGTTGQDRPYFVMEYVKGEPLTLFCDTQGLGIEDRLNLFCKVCEAVSYAHRNLVIHRDLKPTNILVTEEGVPKLLDFGIAKVLASDGETSSQTVVTQRVMTPDYASPEQLYGERITTSSDVYSLGILLYELLTGKRPARLTTGRLAKISDAFAEQEPIRPSRVRKSLRGDLDNITLMALRKEPARRYSSVDRFAEDIRRHLEGLPVSARQDTIAYRAQKFISRHKVGVAAALTICLMLCGGIAAVLHQDQIVRRERDRARRAQATTARLNHFLQGLLSSANPDTFGRDVKVVQVLDAAAARIDHELANDPAILAQAHLTIARAYAQLRAAEPAEHHARAALAIDLKNFGPNDPKTAEAMAFVGRALQVFRRYHEAEPLLRQALAVQRREPSEDRNQYARTLMVLGTVLMKTGRAEGAAPLVEEALTLARALNGEQSVQVADALYTRGMLRHSLRNPAGAIADYRASLNIHRQLKPRQLTFLDPIADLSELLMAKGEIAEAASLLREGQRFAQQSIGEDNPTYGALLGRLALIDFIQQRYAEAVPKLQRCLATVGQVYPKENPEMVLAKTVLGLALTRSGWAAEAEPLLREALQQGKGVSPAQLVLIGTLEGALGECLAARGKLADAETLLQVSSSKLEASFGSTHPKTIEAVKRLDQVRQARTE